MCDINKVQAAPSADLLTPDNAVMLFVDHQPQMFFDSGSGSGSGSGDRAAIINSTVGLAKAALAFDVPAVLTTVAAESFSGPLLPQLAEVFPKHEVIDRTTMNARCGCSCNCSATGLARRRTARSWRSSRPTRARTAWASCTRRASSARAAGCPPWTPAF